MRHHSKKKILGRTAGQRTALMLSLARSLMLHGGIETTLSKAKALRPVAEKLISRAKIDTLASRRLLASRLKNDKKLLEHLTKSVAPKYAERAGGYTRIIKLGSATTHGTEKARIELV